MANIEIEKIDCYFEMISNIRFFGSVFIASYCYYYLIKQFMKKVERVWLVGMAYFMPMVILYYIPFIISNFKAYLIGTIAGLLMMYLLERKNIEQKIFLSVTFFSLRWLTVAMADCINRVFYQYMSSLSEISLHWKIQLGIFLLSSILDLVLSFVFMFFSVWLIQKAYLYKKESMTLKEMTILLIPSLSGMIGYEVLQYYNNVYDKDTGKNIYDMYRSYNGLCFLQYVFFFSAILVIIVIFQDIKRRQEEEKQNSILLGQIEEMKSHISKVESLYQDIRGLKHDMGNHLTVLENLYQKKEFIEAEKYTEKLKDRFYGKTIEMNTGNPVTDIILTEKKREAKEKGIVFQCDFHYPENTNINAFDLSVILNNAITNAIENNRKNGQAYISILSYREKNAYMIEVENSFEGEIKVNEDSELPETHKENKKEHGFGLIHIKKVAQKYYGDIMIEQDGERFKLSILLMVE